MIPMQNGPRVTCPNCGLTYIDDSDWSGPAHSERHCIAELQQKLSQAKEPRPDSFRQAAIVREKGWCGHLTAADPSDLACILPINHDDGVHEPFSTQESDEDLFPDPFTPHVEGWAVQVIEWEDICKTVFSVGSQHFTLAETSTEDREHCAFIKTQFEKALAARDELIRKG